MPAKDGRPHASAVSQTSIELETVSEGSPVPAQQWPLAVRQPVPREQREPRKVGGARPRPPANGPATPERRLSDASQRTGGSDATPPSVRRNPLRRLTPSYTAAAQGDEESPLSPAMTRISSQRSDRVSHVSSHRSTGLSRASTLTTLSYAEVRRNRLKVARQWCRMIVDHWTFQVFTTVLTMYALCGDDFRLLYTNKPADVAFDIVTIFCILVFGCEVVLSTVGKEDYFGSFFFFLDIVATVTMVLDITVINEWMHDDEQDDGSSRGNSDTRFGKLGARTTRIVRVIRLVRILKLYKAVYEANQARKKRAKLAALGRQPGEEDDWDDLDIAPGHGPGKESRVGKRLSDLTIRKVILMVLLMLLFDRSLHMDSSAQYPPSATYSVDLVHEAFTRMQTQVGNTTEKRSSYERSLLGLIYYHSWYTGHAAACPNASPGSEGFCPKAFLSHLFWVGIVSKSGSVLSEKTAAAQVSPGTVRMFESMVTAQTSSSSQDDRYYYAYGNMPEQVQTRLGSEWDTNCDRSLTYQRRGISLIEDLLPSWGVTFQVKCPDDLRSQEIKKYKPQLGVFVDEPSDWHLAFYWDLRPFNQQEAIYNLLTTAWVCLCLCIAAVVFNADANRLVLIPVENMIAKVDAIRRKPMNAMKVADQEFKMEEINKAKAKQEEEKRCFAFKLGGGSAKVELMETVVLEKTIIKLGSLLALGFGEAGAGIVEHNMRGEDSSAINVMVSGVRVECIIGACKIRDFSIYNEVLQTKVMTFVNQIAEIVHGIVDELHGYTLMSGGDQFLMIWRMTDVMGDATLTRKLADMAMLALTRIQGSIHRSAILASYRAHPGLQQRLGTNCRVNISCGLHQGWTIEGAIGSEFKIDASYLSPNVNIAETMERATRSYGVSVLVSATVIELCSKAVAKRCRLIDRVMITGSTEPVEIYVVDLDHSCLSVEPPHVYKKWTSRQRFKVRQFLESEKAAKWTGDVLMKELLDDPDIVAMRALYSVEFLQCFNMGYQNYAEGQWKAAQRMLLRTSTMLGIDDGPSLALLDFMSTYCYKAPTSWQGIRLGNFS